MYGVGSGRYHHNSNTTGRNSQVVVFAPGLVLSILLGITITLILLNLFTILKVAIAVILSHTHHHYA